MQGAKYAGALVLVSLSLAGAADAAEPGFYVGGSVGPTQHDVGPSRGIVAIATLPFPTFPTFPIPGPIGGPIGGVISVASFAAAPRVVSVDDGDLGWSGVLGYRINRHFAAELAYMDFGTADVREQFTILSPTFPPVDVVRQYSIDVHGPALTVLASLPAGPVEVFARAGVLFADEKIEQRFTGGSVSNTVGDEILIAGVGVDWAFAGRWTARLEYQRTGELDQSAGAGDDELDQFALSVLYSL